MSDYIDRLQRQIDLHGSENDEFTRDIQRCLNEIQSLRRERAGLEKEMNDLEHTASRIAKMMGDNYDNLPIGHSEWVFLPGKDKAGNIIQSNSYITHINIDAMRLS